MRIKKTSETTPIQAQVVNTESNSTQDTYSCDYINNAVKEVYSTDEQVIGTWIDGKPIYRKVIDFGNLPNGTDKSVNHNISNLEYMVRLYGFTYPANSNGTLFILPHTSTAGAGNNIALFSSSSQITIGTGSVDRSSIKAYVIAEYTKTTDTTNT